MFSSIDVTASTAGNDTPTQDKSQEGALMVALLRRMIAQQDKTNDLLQELIQQGRLQQQARQTELERWKQSNPELARSCREAVEVLSDVQNEFLQSLTNEVDENEYSLRDSDYMLQEFVDRYGPRLAHLNGVLQVLSQLAEKDAS
ncbi:MAG: hypothetical protein CMM06_05615 [Rhodopirellula sp.]|nr:hypothetical protein [Rhodopirellula sp.]MBL98960.1 hypothetical protein [Rhodopirellula sp.]MBL99151.1 hypothetical protein [Rhodopirellula sp.]HCA51307.1 hypothetical protein [Planctomycetaceae bacterium]